MAKGADSSGKGKRAGRNGNAPPASRRWKPGQSGNPKGRPKGSVGLMRIIREMLQESVPGRDVTLAEVLDRAVIREIVKDPVRAWPMLREFILRDEGPAAGPVGEGEVIVSDRPEPDSEAFHERLLRMVEMAEAKAPPEASPSPLK